MGLPVGVSDARDGPNRGCARALLRSVSPRASQIVGGCRSREAGSTPGFRAFAAWPWDVHSFDGVSPLAQAWGGGQGSEFSTLQNCGEFSISFDFGTVGDSNGVPDTW